MKYEAQNRYDKTNTIQIRLKLNTKTDIDIIGKLNSVGNKQGYLKELMRREDELEERYVIRDHEAGNEIERFNTKVEAIEEMKRFVISDKAEGTYEEGFYEVYDLGWNEVVEVSK